MHDPRVLLDPATDAVRKLARRGHQLDLPHLEKLFATRTATVGELDESRAESNRVAKEVGAAAKRGEDVTAAREQARTLKARIQELEERHRQLAAELEEFLINVPNLPSDEVPDGNTDDDAVEVATWGERPEFDFTPRDHVDLGERLGILDLARATKISGPRFSVLRGVGARLERALALYMLELHTERN
ncbi:MAG TPA: serine--tRNA ligase, partial [Actinophytocola sp.]|nr:serine--tRNA ligase [Actinophytocola sp.]